MMFGKYAMATLTNLTLKRGILHGEIHDVDGKLLMAGTFVMCADVLAERGREALEVQVIEERAAFLQARNVVQWTYSGPRCEIRFEK